MITAWMLFIVLNSKGLIQTSDISSAPSSQWLYQVNAQGIETECGALTTDDVAQFEMEYANEN